MPTPQPAAFDEPNWRWDLGIQAFKNSLSMFLRPALGWKPLRSPHGSPVSSRTAPLPLLLLGLAPVLPSPRSDFLGHAWTSTAADGFGLRIKEGQLIGQGKEKPLLSATLLPKSLVSPYTIFYTFEVTPEKPSPSRSISVSSVPPPVFFPSWPLSPLKWLYYSSRSYLH